MIRALIFDVFGTVVDWRNGIARQADQFFGERNMSIDGIAFSQTWRSKYQSSMEKIRSECRAYVNLDILHRENLEATLIDFGLAGKFSDTELEDFNHAWEFLPPWPDSVSGLTKLKSKFIISPCSNGSIALMTQLAKNIGLPWDLILGAEIARDYKPQPAVYLASAAALGMQSEEVMMVAAHNGDLAAARNTGLKTAFLPRPTEYGPDQTSDLEATSKWDVIAQDLDDLADQMISQAP